MLRDIRLQALRESPDGFAASHQDEAERGERFWRDRLRAAPWLVAERDGATVGVVGLRVADEHDPEVGEVLGLWVAPPARGSRVAAELVWAAAKEAYDYGCRQLYFWVAADNGAAVAFASTFGFRPTDERRPAERDGEGASGQPGEEVAMVLPLEADPGSVKNPWLP